MTVSKWSMLMLILVFSLLFGLIGCGEQATTGSAIASRAPSQPTVISKIVGEVLVLKAGTTSWSEASSGMTLESGDRIKTGAGSNALVTFFEGSTIELVASTEISVDELGIAEPTNSTVIKLRQQIGKTTSRVQKLVDPASRYEIETPDGAAVVRGSVGDVIVTEGNSTTIVNRQGQWSAIFGGREIQIPQGYQITFVRGQLVIPVPVPVSLPPIIPSPSLPSPSSSSLQPPSPSGVWQTWIQTTANEFNADTCDNVTVIDVGDGDGTVVLSTAGPQKRGYVQSGTLESSSYDCGSSADFGTVSWDALALGFTVLKFQIATNNDNATWNFVGPGGSSMTYYETSGANIWSGHDGNRYIRYKAYLITINSNQTPYLEEVRIDYLTYH